MFPPSTMKIREREPQAGVVCSACYFSPAKLRAYAETPSAKWHLRSAEICQSLGHENRCRNQSFSAWNNGLSAWLNTGADDGQGEAGCDLSAGEHGKQTVDNQRRELKAAAASRGWPVVAVYADEGISGAKEREGPPQSI